MSLDELKRSETVADGWVRNSQDSEKRQVIGDGCDPAPVCDDTGLYRSIDGSCNNINNPNWGRALTPQDRFVTETAYDNGNINYSYRSLYSQLALFSP